MNSTTPQAKHAKKLANILCLKLPNKKLTITKADASAQSGLSLKNSEVALLYLISEYRGNLSITDLGELIFQFPYGFNKPWKKKEKYLILLNKYKKLFSITTKFIIRAWLAITLIIYISIFSLILITISLIKNHNEDKDDKFS